MFNLEKISLNFAFPPFYFFLAFLLLAGYTFFVYRYTIPQIGRAKKILLIILRIAALLLLLFAFFEPVLSLAKRKILESVNLIFIDNSRSMSIRDGTERETTVKSFLKDLNKSGLSNNSELFIFGSNVKGIDNDSLQKINFSEGSTNFSDIFSAAGKPGINISSVVIISDGEITDGQDPLHTAEKLNIPVYTVGIGDTTSRNDISVKDVIHNDLIYSETPTPVVAVIANTGFSGKNVIATLMENNKQVDQKSVTLSGDGVQNVEFTYTPKTSGQKKLTVSVANSAGEFTYANNKRIFYINVLSNKIKVLVIAGSPSSDVSFIVNTLETDENLSVNSIIQTAPDKFIKNNDMQMLLDSANVLFLAGFPSKETSQAFIQSVLKSISEKDKPFFIEFANGIDFTKLKLFQSELAFTINKVNQDNIEIQPDVPGSQLDNPLLQNNAANTISAWNNLPPVFQPNVDIQPKPESEILSRVKINNIPMNRPLILTRRLGAHKSVSVLAGDIWKWKLETVPQGLDLYDRFILASVKWLNSKDDHKQVVITTSRKIYSLGEPVEFSAQVYDQSFNPVQDAEIKINIRSEKENSYIDLNSLGNGLYEGKFNADKPGDYSFSGTASLNGEKLGSDSGNFNVGEVDVEMMNPRMNYEYLSLLANQTGGKFFYNNQYSGLFSILKNRIEKSSKDKIETNEVNLWSNEWLLLAAVVLFGIEWFLRKRNGML